MKNCRAFEKQLTAYLHGELSPSDSQAVGAHLETCSACRAELDAQRATLVLLNEALAAAPAPEKLAAWHPLPEQAWVKRRSPKTGWAQREYGRSQKITMLGVRIKAISIAAVFMCSLIFLSGSLVVFSVVNKSGARFCPPPPLASSPKMKLKKSAVKVRKSMVPASSPRIASKSQQAMSEIALPEISGTGRGFSGGIDGFETMADEGDVSLFGSSSLLPGDADKNGLDVVAESKPMPKPVPEPAVESRSGRLINNLPKEEAEAQVVQVEAKFVEIAKGSLEELGFVWRSLDEISDNDRSDAVLADGDDRALSLRCLERFKKKAEPAAFNPYVLAEQNAFSTFSIDVDTAAYGLARQQLLAGALPEPEMVRTEEFINSFDYDYRPPAGTQTFSVHEEMAPSPFRSGMEILKIGIKGRRIGRDDHRGAVLTLVIDTSGSMSTPERLGLVKQSLTLLLDQLSPTDVVAIVQFGTEARLVCEHTPVIEKETLLKAIHQLQPGGPTQFDLGLELGYKMATDGFRAGDSNRILILSDGVANLGELDPDAILEQVADYRKKGIYLSVLGFGAGTYDDNLMEQLANRGDGMYAYIDTLDEARRLLVDQLASTLHVIASDVKIQVEFNPARVLRYRQVGYENRQLTKEQFRDDTVDAGEVGSGQAVTALYDVQLKPDGPAAEPIATVYVRYRRADNGAVEEISSRVTDAVRAPRFVAADVRFRLAVCAAEFAERLRRSPYAEGSELSDIIHRLTPVTMTLDLDEQVQELLRLIQMTERMEP